MAVKFYTDEHIHPGIVKALRKRGIDVLTSQQASMLGIKDAEHLKFATSQGRTLLTQDSDFLELQWKIKHSGIAYARQHTPFRQIIDGAILIHETMTEEEMQNHVEYI